MGDPAKKDKLWDESRKALRRLRLCLATGPPLRWPPTGTLAFQPIVDIRTL
jgi:hypothetical protein